MIHDPARHEALQVEAWDEARVRAAIGRIVAGTEAQRLPQGLWPIHPRDQESFSRPGAQATQLYDGACGVIWALHHLQDLGAARLSRSHVDGLGPLLQLNRAELPAPEALNRGSYLMGDTPILLQAHRHQPEAGHADALAALIEGHLDHPARELMWGAPGTLLAALFLHRRTGEVRWAELFRRTAARLWSQLETSPTHGCRFWVQALYGRRSSYLDAVHGFVATASPLIAGRHLLDATDWLAWQACIVHTVQVSATREGALVNWRAELDEPAGRPVKWLMQFCHGAPGFVICLAGLPDDALDALLLGAGETIWQAGPLVKGSNLCHGTAGNGYAFLKLHRRTGDATWLARARAFAMHAIGQFEAEALAVGRLRHSLWTGDIGLAIYLWHCLQATADFPTLDVFDA